MSATPSPHEAQGEGIPILFSVLLVVLSIFAVWCATLVTAAGELRRDLAQRDAWLAATGALESEIREPSQTHLRRVAALASFREIANSLANTNSEVVQPYVAALEALGGAQNVHELNRLGAREPAALQAFDRLSLVIREQSTRLSVRLTGIWTQLYLLIGATLLLVACLAGAMWVRSGDTPLPPPRTPAAT